MTKVSSRSRPKLLMGLVVVEPASRPGCVGLELKAVVLLWNQLGIAMLDVAIAEHRIGRSVKRPWVSCAARPPKARDSPPTTLFSNRDHIVWDSDAALGNRNCGGVQCNAPQSHSGAVIELVAGPVGI